MADRLTKNGWLDLGLKALAEDGPDALTIDALCTRSGKTRGSFYHHFSSVDSFIQAMLDRWKLLHVDMIIAKIEKSRTATNSEKFDNLNNLAARLDPAIETGIRHLSASNSTAARICHQADLQRLEYLTSLYSASPLYDKKSAAALAKIDYAAWIGLQFLQPDATPAQTVELYRHFLSITGRA